MPLFISLFLFLGCATSYKPKSFFGGGYYESRISDNVFQISFDASPFTSDKSISDYILLRSAQITLKEGYKYFVIANDNSKGDSSFLELSMSSFPNAIFAKPQDFSSTIILLKENLKEDDSYDAKIIYDQISKKYNIQ